MQRPARSGWPKWILAGLASAIVMLSFIIPLGRAFLSRSSEPSSSAAGSPSSPRIGFSIERDGKVQRGASGDVVLPGDRIRFTYSSESDAQFALLHVSRGNADVYFPRAESTVLVPAGRDAAVDLTVELDNRAGTDRVFGLFCEASVALEPVRAALQKDDDGSFEHPGCRVDSVTLRKKLL